MKVSVMLLSFAGPGWDIVTVLAICVDEAYLEHRISFGEHQ